MCLWRREASRVSWTMHHTDPAASQLPCHCLHSIFLETDCMNPSAVQAYNRAETQSSNPGYITAKYLSLQASKTQLTVEDRWTCPFRKQSRRRRVPCNRTLSPIFIFAFATFHTDPTTCLQHTIEMKLFKSFFKFFEHIGKWFHKLMHKMKKIVD